MALADFAPHVFSPHDCANRCDLRSCFHLGQHLVFLSTAQEIDGTFLPAAVPGVEVHARLVVNEQHAPALGDVLAKPFGFDPFERAHVVLVQSLAGGQMSQGLRAQVQAVKCPTASLAPSWRGACAAAGCQ